MEIGERLPTIVITLVLPVGEAPIVFNGASPLATANQSGVSINNRDSA